MRSLYSAKLLIKGVPMNLDKEVPGCFGDKDLVFAGQPLNKGRAFGWLNSLRKREIGGKPPALRSPNISSREMRATRALRSS